MAWTEERLRLARERLQRQMQDPVFREKVQAGQRRHLQKLNRDPNRKEMWRKSGARLRERLNDPEVEARRRAGVLRHLEKLNATRKANAKPKTPKQAARKPWSPEARQAQSERAKARCALIPKAEKIASTTKRLSTFKARRKRPGPTAKPVRSWCPEKHISLYVKLRGILGAAKARAEILEMIQKETADVALQAA